MASAAPVADGALYEVACDEAARALAEQLSLIDGYRTRAGLLLSVAAIATSLLGARALDCGNVGLLVWAALGSFFAVAVLSLAILWPRPHEFAADSTRIIEKYIDRDEPRSPAALQHALILQMQQSYTINRGDLGQLAIFFEVASALLATEVLLLDRGLARLGYR